MSDGEKRGYCDPTADEAIANVMREAKAAKSRYRPLVYVASPYAGDVEANVSRARECCAFAVRRGCIPLAPHLHYPQFMDDGKQDERELALFFALVLLGKCDELWAFGDVVSKGMRGEIDKANRRGIPIRYFNNQFQEVTHHGKQTTTTTLRDEFRRLAEEHYARGDS
jgi:hypothetical protein